MKIKVSHIIAKISKVKNVSKNQPIEDTSLPSIMLTDNQIIAEGSSSYISVYLEHPLNKCQIPIDGFTQMLSKFNPENYIELNMQGDDEQSILIKYKSGRKRSKISLPLHTERSIHVLDIESKESFTHALPESFHDGLKKCQHALPTDHLKPHLICFNIRDNSVLATDGIRCSSFGVDDEISDFMISAFDGQMIMENNFTSYRIHEDFIDFFGDGIFARVAMIVDNKSFPVFDDSLFEYDHSVLIDRIPFTKQLDESSLFAQGSYEGDYKVTLEINGKSYVIRSQNSFGKITARGRFIRSDIDRITIDINPIFLKQCLDQIKEDQTQIGYSNYGRLSLSSGKFSHALATYTTRKSKDEDD